MNLIRNFFWATLALVITVIGATGAEPLKVGPAYHVAGTNQATGSTIVKLTAPKPNVGRLYLDAGISFTTPDFKRKDDSYLVGVGYQVSPHWAIEGRATHYGLDADGSAVQSLGGRLVARMPFEFLAPYSFLGASFNLENDAWHLQPGGGIEVGVNRRLKGLSVFAEGGLDANLHGRSGYVFTGGVRLRF